MWTFSNILTIIRILLLPFIVIFYAFLPNPYNHWISFTLYCLAGITDFFDGYFARKFKETSSLGSIMDPIADKLMVTTTLLLLIGFNVLDKYNIIAAGIVICRELLVSGLREFLSQFKGLSMAVSILAKWKTTSQILALGFLIVGDAISVIIGTKTYDVTIIGIALLWISALLTVITGWSYLKKAGDYITKN